MSGFFHALGIVQPVAIAILSLILVTPNARLSQRLRIPVALAAFVFSLVLLVHRLF